MKTRSQNPRFYYEFKANRTILTREKEIEKKEPFHIVFMKKLDAEAEEKKKAKQKAEKLQ